MKIKVPHNGLRQIQRLIKQYRLRHGPFRKTGQDYLIYLYPNNKNTLFLLSVGNQDFSVLDMD